MAMKRVRRGWLPLVILGALASIALVGCGGIKRVPVSGTVTMDGKPLNDVVVFFSPDAAKGNNSQINCTGPVTDGRYQLQTVGVTRSTSGPGVPPGWYKVTVKAPNISPRKQPKARVELNDKYKNVDKTPLSVEVKDNPEPGAYDFKLEK